MVERAEEELFSPASLDVHAIDSMLNDIVEASTGTVVCTVDGSVQHTHVTNRSVLYKDGRALVNGAVGSVEHVIFPYFFSHGSGFYARHTHTFNPLGPQASLQHGFHPVHRVRCVFAPLEVN